MLRSILGLLMLANVSGTTEMPTEPTLNHLSFDETALLEVSPVPKLQNDYLAPDIKARAALLMDLDTGIVLYEKDAYEALPMASLTKIMTAMVIMENHDLDEVVTIESDFKGLQGVRIWLRQYDRLSVESLLKALLIRSAGDAAIALAEHHSGTVEAFVEAMNETAARMNLTKTHFENPVGLDADGHVSSAYDLATLSRYAMQMPAFRRIVAMDAATIESVDGSFSYSFDSTNYLLNSYLNILGVKTGTTDAAGQSLINVGRSETGQEVIAVVLNSPQRFQENKSMIDWAFRSYRW